MNVKSKLMQKNGIMAVTLARGFLAMEVGSRIPTIAQLAEKYTSARGTVQNAIKFLQDYNAVKLEPRGHLGTFIISIDYSKLMEIADIKTLLGVMPLPYSKAYEGLATGIYNTLNIAGLSAGLAFMRGATKRIDALLDGRYDFAVISKLAAEYYIEEGAELQIVQEFGDFTYVNEHVIIFREKEKSHIEDGMRIAIDNSSLDQVLLTHYHCRDKKVELIPVIYSQVSKAILKGDIDAAIWNKDDIIEKKAEVHYSSIDNSYFLGKDTNAVVVSRSENASLNTLLKKFLNKDKVLFLQKKVIGDEIIPNY